MILSSAVETLGFFYLMFWGLIIWAVARGHVHVVEPGHKRAGG
jgi:ABC-type nickel/cobalt efflux system permease component RcnA